MAGTEEERWEQINKLYHAAQEKDPDERAAFLDTACKGDDELRREVESLLAANEPASGSLAEPALEVAAQAVAEERIDHPEEVNLLSTQEMIAPDRLSTQPATQKLEASRLMPRGPKPQAGSHFGPYRFIQPLGRGGFGEVWEAESLQDGRRLALKLVTEVRARSSEALQRFRREGQLAASISHPNCVYIFGAEEIEGCPVISMELMRGGTLQDLLNEEGPIPWKQAVDRILDVIAGLEAADRMGIIHRDVKPSNCFLDEEGRVKIGDFGLSKTLELDSDLTTIGKFIGTPAYASPEQVRGREVDHRSDIYSVGATLYALLTGKPPFQADRAGELLARIVSEQPVPFSQYPVNVSKALQRVVLRALAKDKGKRYPDYASLRAALLPFSSHGLTAASMGKRILAFQVDSLPFLPLNLVYAPIILEGSDLAVVVQLCAFMGMVAYFAVPEKVWGRSLGKYLLGLYVTTGAGSVITWRQAFLRAFVFLGLPQLLSMMWLFGRFSNPHLLTFVLIHWLVLFSSMRQRNGYAGIHELASNTRVRAIRKTEFVSVPQSELSETSSTAAPSVRFGPYRATQAVWQTESASLWLAHDDVLKRKVWIHELHNAAAAAPMSRLTVNRPGRLRWLQGSRQADQNWDAYEAPSGTSLYHWVTAERRLSWAEMRQVLLVIVVELRSRNEQRDSAQPFSLRSIWVTAGGQPKLLDFPAFVGSSVEAEAVARPDWSLLLHQMALFALEGRHIPLGELNARIPRVPIPEYVRPVMDIICAQSHGCETLDAISAKLEEMATRPATVSRVKRVSTLLLPVAPLLMGVAGMLFFSFMFSRMPEWMNDMMVARSYISVMENLERTTDNSQDARQKREAIRQVLAFSYAKAQASKSSPFGAQVVQQLPNEVKKVLESALRDYPSTSEKDIAEAKRILVSNSRISQMWRFQANPLSSPGLLDVFANLLAYLSIAVILGSFLFRGGALFYLFGIAVQTQDGRKASRLRCLLRSFLGWSPIVAILVLPKALGQPAYVVAAFLLSLTLAGAVYCVVKPERGIQDLIAGTHLVPR